MGYSTDFWGQFNLNKQLDPATHELLKKLAETRRMARKGLDPAVYGVEGEFYCGSGMSGQDHENNIIDYNRPPSTQPGLWLQWKPTPDGLHIEWDGGEKFYNYEEWIEYLIDKILAPRGYVLNGNVSWQGEDSEDRGILVIKNNVLTTKVGRTTYAAPRKRTPKRTKLQQIAWIDKRMLELKTEKKRLMANG